MHCEGGSAFDHGGAVPFWCPNSTERVNALGRAETRRGQVLQAGRRACRGLDRREGHGQTFLCRIGKGSMTRRDAFASLLVQRPPPGSTHSRRLPPPSPLFCLHFISHKNVFPRTRLYSRRGWHQPGACGHGHTGVSATSPICLRSCLHAWPGWT